jgi:hypothetical protein
VLVLAGVVIAAACGGTPAAPGRNRAALAAGPATATTALAGTSTSAPGSTAGVLSSSASTSTTPAASATDASAVEAAYRAFWDMYVRVNDPPDDANPEIDALAVGPALDALVAIVRGNIAAGTVFRPAQPSQTSHRVEVRSIAGPVASVHDCFVDDGLVVEASSGRVVNAAVATKEVSATLLLVDGRWKVFDDVFESRLEGVAGCAR